MGTCKYSTEILLPGTPDLQIPITGLTSCFHIQGCSNSTGRVALRLEFSRTYPQSPSKALPVTHWLNIPSKLPSHYAPSGWPPAQPEGEKRNGQAEGPIRPRLWHPRKGRGLRPWLRGAGLADRAGCGGGRFRMCWLVPGAAVNRCAAGVGPGR